MAPYPPKRLRTPILLGGPNARALAPELQAIGFNAKFYSEEIGRASSVKMCRSIMIKGLEALALECTLTAHHYGVEDECWAHWPKRCHMRIGIGWPAISSVGR